MCIPIRSWQSPSTRLLLSPPSEAPSHGSSMDVVEEDLHDPTDDPEDWFFGGGGGSIYVCVYICIDV